MVTPVHSFQPRDRVWLRTVPTVLLIVAVAGTSLVSVLATSLGLMPLFGEPELSTAGYTQRADELLASVGQTLIIAVASTALSAAIGLAAATVMVRDRRPWLQGLAVVVVTVPHLVGAASVALLLSDSGLLRRFAGYPDAWPVLVGGPIPVATVAEFAWKESAFVALVVTAAVSRRYQALDETAATLGAGPATRWRRVFVPLASPALAVSSLIVFIYTVGSYEVPALLGQASPEPLSVVAFRLFGAIDLAARPAAAAAAALGAAVALLAAVLALPLLRHLNGPR